MTEENRLVRAAVQRLITSRGVSYQQSQQITINSIDNNYVASQNLIAASNRYNDKMSYARRFFCLLVTFDFSITCLLWLICIVTTGQTFKVAIIQQFINYQIKTSLFDIVVIAAIRFIFLLLFYGLIRINNWILIAISTASTSALMGAKVYLFDWLGNYQPGFPALLILTSFVIAWAEIWYLDCRVVPQEMAIACLRIMNAMDCEHTPLLGENLTRQSSYLAESTVNFFTPQESPTHSDNEDNNHDHDDQICNSEIFYNLSALSTTKIDEYKRMASSLIDCANELLLSSDWKTINRNLDGDVLSIMSHSCGKVFKIQGVIDAKASVLIDYLFENVEDLPRWNKDVVDAKRIKLIDSNTDIVYQSTKPYGGGLIGARDFLTLRARGKRGNYFITSGTSVHCDFPIRKNFIRGENVVACVATEDILYENENNGKYDCKLTWILNTNLKGWLPQKVIDKALTASLVNFMKMLRLCVKNLPQNAHL